MIESKRELLQPSRSARRRRVQRMPKRIVHGMHSRLGPGRRLQSTKALPNSSPTEPRSNRMGKDSAVKSPSHPESITKGNPDRRRDLPCNRPRSLLVCLSSKGLGSAVSEAGTPITIGLVFIVMGLLPSKPEQFRLCAQCGYNLTSNTSGKCPECGTGVTEGLLQPPNNRGPA